MAFNSLTTKAPVTGQQNLECLLSWLQVEGALKPYPTSRPKTNLFRLQLFGQIILVTLL